MAMQDSTSAVTPHALLGVGVRPSRTSGERDAGHMWMNWSRTTSPHPPYRGYYPCADQLPEYTNLREFVEFFLVNAVPGIRVVDYRAIELLERHPDRCLDHKWDIDDPQKDRLELRCWVPPGTDSVQEGKYSLDTEHPGWHNCVSWALEVVDHVMNVTEYLPRPRPARIRTFIQAVWPTS